MSFIIWYELIKDRFYMYIIKTLETMKTIESIKINVYKFEIIGLSWCDLILLDCL